MISNAFSRQAAWCRRLGSALTALFIATALMGCSQLQLPPDTVFPDGKGVAGLGLLVVGLQVTSPPTYAIPKPDPVKLSPDYDVEFRNVTADGKLGSTAYKVFPCPEIQRKVDCAPGQRVYRAVLVKPGRYLLDTVTFSTGYMTGYTSFVGPRQTDYFASPLPTVGFPVRNVDKTFVIGPGEIVYAGDLLFRYGVLDRPATVRFSRDDAAARQFLKTYPFVKGDLEYRPAAIPQ